MDKTLVEIIVAARDSLTPANWKKGSFFKKENNNLCMCAHGAVQALVNPVCKIALQQLDIANAGASAGAGADGQRAGAGARARAGAGAGANWTNRPDWVKNDRIYDNINYGNGEAHYLLGMVGLTIGFNDRSDTTYEMVIEKFNEAIELATRLGLS